MDGSLTHSSLPKNIVNTQSIWAWVERFCPAFNPGSIPENNHPNEKSTDSGDLHLSQSLFDRTGMNQPALPTGFEATVRFAFNLKVLCPTWNGEMGFPERFSFGVRLKIPSWPGASRGGQSFSSPDAPMEISYLVSLKSIDRSKAYLAGIQVRTV